jgi:hypothetical protein
MYLAKCLEKVGVQDVGGTGPRSIVLGEVVVGERINEDLAVNGLEAFGEAVEHRHPVRLLGGIVKVPDSQRVTEMASSLEEVGCPERAVERY